MCTVFDVLEANAWLVFYKAASSARIPAFLYEGVGNLEVENGLPLGPLGNVFKLKLINWFRLKFYP
jgi:hypothetical protein